MTLLPERWNLQETIARKTIDTTETKTRKIRIMIENIINSSQKINRKIELPVDEIERIYATNRVLLFDPDRKKVWEQSVAIFEDPYPVRVIHQLIAHKSLINTGKYHEGRLMLSWSPAFYGDQGGLQ